MKEKIVSIFSSIGALISGCLGSCGVACLATGCCGGTAILGFIGLSGSVLKVFEVLTPLFLVLTVISLAYGFYKAYKPKKAACCSQAASGESASASCCEKEKKESFFQSKAFLWAITILCIVMWTYPLVIKGKAQPVKESTCCPAESVDSTMSACCPPAKDSIQ